MNKPAVPQTKRLIPLDLLEPAAENPRKHSDASAIDELANSIATHGLLQNLVVYWDGERGRVVAGGRRLQALKKLAGENRLPEDIKLRGVPCEVIPEERALEVAIVENLQREDVPPLEEAEAFAQLQNRGLPIKEIALRVGKSEKLVRERLALARSLVPEIKRLLQNGKLTLSAAIQITKLPKDIQTDLAGRYLIDPKAAEAYLKTYLKQEGVPRSIIVFPLERYLEEGGGIVEGLFGEEPILTNRPLVAKLQEAAAEVIANRFKDQHQDVVLFKGGFDPAKWRPTREGESGRTLVVFDPETLKVEVLPNQVEAEKPEQTTAPPPDRTPSSSSPTASKPQTADSTIEVRDQTNDLNLPKRLHDEYLDLLAEVAAKRVAAGGDRLAKAAALLALLGDPIRRALRIHTRGTERTYPEQQNRRLWDQENRYENAHKRFRDATANKNPLEALLALDPAELDHLFTLTIASLAEPALANRRPTVGETDEKFLKGFPTPLLKKALVELEGKKPRLPKKKSELIAAIQKHANQPLPDTLVRATDNIGVPEALRPTQNDS